MSPALPESVEQHRFFNACMSLMNLDMHELVAAGIIAEGNYDNGGTSWKRFNDEPLVFLAEMDDAKRDALWKLLDARQRVKAEPDFAASIAEVIKEEFANGAACGWKSCSGCHETNEGAETGFYPYSKMFGCYVGSGCSECGGLGVVWEYWPQAIVEEMARQRVKPEEFQARVRPWMLACFGEEISRDRMERYHRFLEESLELVQSTGCTQSEAHQLVEYVYGREVGETHQEIGGVMVTLAALCLAIDEDMHAAGETELARIWTKVEKIRAKHAAKPKHSPLPQHATHPVPSVPLEWPLDAPQSSDPDDCLGHVASEANPKICGRCGIHIDELRPPDGDPA